MAQRSVGPCRFCRGMSNARRPSTSIVYERWCRTCYLQHKAFQRANKAVPLVGKPFKRPWKFNPWTGDAL